MTTPPRPLPPHPIRREDVPTWLAGSAITFMTAHRTSAERARRIIDEGPRIDRFAIDLTWGIGFYSSTRADSQYGTTSVRVAIRLENPFIAEDTRDDQERLDALRAAAGDADASVVLQAAGYYGVVVHFGQAETWVVAYSEDQIKVVVER